MGSGGGSSGRGGASSFGNGGCSISFDSAGASGVLDFCDAVPASGEPDLDSGFSDICCFGFSELWCMVISNKGKSYLQTIKATSLHKVGVQRKRLILIDSHGEIRSAQSRVLQRMTYADMSTWVQITISPK